ncbi:DUF1579 domain-containing protein [Pseudoduganella eburnea]|uniref:DUF1579 domain-containing protein n=1 Tax=Massilia eburnea TaxID=1776165 RepID=A0A6L6QNI4_9BURK|nr:DUF1579 family protein [Massilia eburnea]MTW13681.1 DUF1579 domain-containing protein [Massilia eburnea]
MNDVWNLLELFAGDWAGVEEITLSKWGPGGSASASISARLEFGGRVLVQDYSAERDGKQWFKAHAVIAFDQQTSSLSLHWFDSMGFVPASPAPGQWDGEALRFVRTSLRGQTRHTYVFVGAATYELSLESSFDGGASWEPVMKGRYMQLGAK